MRSFQSAILALAIAMPIRAIADDAADFREHVEPLLKKRCYGCHSHAARDIKGGLTLDWKSGWAKGGDRGPAIVAGDPDRSVLIRAVRHVDADLKMPEDKLPDAEIEVLVNWVRRGAIDPREARPAASAPDDWWSLRPLRKPAVPPGGAHPIDAFLRGFHSIPHGLLQSRDADEADRRTLLRRLTFDLHGLPPTVDELGEFAADDRPDAVERLIDRLLSSPRYGEQWARHWFDVIHFADTHGFEHDYLREHAWRYRDYVIERLNDDVPWDQFIHEQLAADVLAAHDTRRIAALGFLGAGPYDYSAAQTAPKSFEYLDRDDLVTQVLGAFVSTTVGCARCHDHKFDPISQEDYFALQAVFAGVAKGDISYDEDASVATQRRKWLTLLDAATRRDKSELLAAEHESLVGDWEATARLSATWRTLRPQNVVSRDGQAFTRCDDDSILAGGARPEVDVVTVTSTTDLREVTALRLEVLADESLPMKGPGRQDNGNLHLSEIELQFNRPGATQPEKVAFVRASADFDQVGWTAAHAIDGHESTAWGIHPRVGESHQAIFELKTPAKIEPGTELSIAMKQVHGRGHLLGRLRLAVTNGPPATAIALPADVAAALAIPREQRTTEQQLAVSATALARTAEMALTALPAQAKVYGAAVRVQGKQGMIVLSEPRPIHVLHRGDLTQPRMEATPGTLSVVKRLPTRFALPNPKDESARRRALAEWIASPENPLTWRSIANRVWQFHFGVGICHTPSDFGRMGEPPSHPELLDWLACELRDHGGSLKHLHRLICTSTAYRQSSRQRDEAAAIDPENRWLWRMNRRRLGADEFRDAVLAASGRLDLRMGGSGVSHFVSQPGIQETPSLDYRAFDWSTPAARRRGIYRVVWRGIADPFMESLDFPDLSLMTPARSFSASPLQSLALLNNEFILYHSEQFAHRAEQHTASHAEQVRFVVREALQREPTAEEAAAFEALASKHALAAVCRVMFNTNEFLFIE